jgi:eukaryotic-like serine/threonine-protein kinase
MTVKLQLGQAWTLGERIGGGGFGQVFAARSETGDDVVAKLVPKAPGAEREMLFVNLSDVRNVVPVIVTARPTTPGCW